MAIGISGTNSNTFSSVEVSVGPAGVTHKKDKSGLELSPIGQLSFVLSGCFDPANRKCYSGSGMTATDFVSGINYTITGNANSDTIYKSDNLGIIEVTGNGYIRANGSYSVNEIAGQGGSNTIEMWFWPSTGPAEEQAIFQLRKNNNGSYENGHTVVRRAVGNNRAISVYTYTNDGNYYSVVSGTFSNAIFLDTWNQIIMYDFRIDSNSRFRLYQIVIKSAYHEYNSNLVSVSFADGSNEEPDGYDDSAPRELTIGKAEGITGTFKGKIGSAKIYQGPIFNTNADPEIDPENINGYQNSWKRLYQYLAPRYDQYD